MLPAASALVSVIGTVKLLKDVKDSLETVHNSAVYVAHSQPMKYLLQQTNTVASVATLATNLLPTSAQTDVGHGERMIDNPVMFGMDADAVPLQRYPSHNHQHQQNHLQKVGAVAIAIASHPTSSNMPTSHPRDQTTVGRRKSV